jgi:hypothetical protein
VDYMWGSGGFWDIAYGSVRVVRYCYYDIDLHPMAHEMVSWSAILLPTRISPKEFRCSRIAASTYSYLHFNVAFYTTAKNNFFALPFSFNLGMFTVTVQHGCTGPVIRLP